MEELMNAGTSIGTPQKLEDVLHEEIKVIKGMARPEDHLAASLVHKAIGDRLHCVFVDNGLLRYEERERTMETFEQDLYLLVTCVDAQSNFCWVSAPCVNRSHGIKGRRLPTNKLQRWMAVESEGTTAHVQR
ncbi:hypothetical protein ACSBR1_041673 [Camellia fascicularis]